MDEPVAQNEPRRGHSGGVEVIVLKNFTKSPDSELEVYQRSRRRRGLKTDGLMDGFYTQYLAFPALTPKLLGQYSNQSAFAAGQD